MAVLHATISVIGMLLLLGGVVNDSITDVLAGGIWMFWGFVNAKDAKGKGG